MKVYLVLLTTWDDLEYYEKIFSTEQKAKKYCEQQNSILKEQRIGYNQYIYEEIEPE